MIYKVNLDGKTYEVEVEAGEARLIDEYETCSSAPQAPAAAPAAVPAAVPEQVSGAGEVITSPVPGTILSVEVQVGQVVKEGDTVIVLEAMKMENEISASRSGTVTQVLTSKGAVVETGAPLVVIG